VFRAEISSETSRRSTLAELPVGARVNLELPLRVGDALEGHLVQGHVDAVAKVVRIEEEPLGRRVWLRPPARFLDSVVPKGSVTVDGVSLTVAEEQRDRFAIALEPVSLAATTLGALSVGDRVNLEGDLLDRLAQRYEGRTRNALQRVVAAMPWKGCVSGRLGVEKVVAQIAAGGCAVVWDPTREGEGDVIAAGAELSPHTFAFLLTQVFGHTTVPCDRERLERLEIPAMQGAGDHHGTAMYTRWTLGGARHGVSAAERAATVRRLAHPTRGRRTSCGPGTCFRSARAPADCASARVTPRRRSRCVAQRGSRAWACAAR
jgi:3,4-dihydroxy 2-butanone 4-phosphate synthase/3,4-dihydroxy 2-butanone 4-phosphate synthase/GTP cyclohydrolase II